MEGVRPSPTLASLFEGAVVAREYHGVASLEALHTEEAALVAKAVSKRRAAFAAGRLCARSALQALAADTGPLLWDEKRAPVWPREVVGSITHTEGFCGAVVADRATYGGIGVDAERNAGVEEKIWQQVLTAAERNRMFAYHPSKRAEIATVIFCAKEAFYKAQYQTTHSWLGFECADVGVTKGEFVIELLTDAGTFARADCFKGKYAVVSEIVVAGIALPSVQAYERHPSS